jgi:hypothetical protein
VINPRLANAEEAANWFSLLVIHNMLIITVPEDGYKSVATRLRKVAADGNVKILTRYDPKEGTLNVRTVGTAKRIKKTTPRVEAR